MQNISLRPGVVGFTALILILLTLALPAASRRELPVEPDLVIVGIHLSSAGHSMAIVENRSSGKQDVFSVGGSVFGKGKLLQIREKSLLLSSTDGLKRVLPKHGITINRHQPLNSSDTQASFSGGENAVAERDTEAYTTATVDIEETSTGQLAVQVDGSLVEAQWNDIPRMIYEAGFEVLANGTQPVGCKVTHVPEKSLLADIGLQDNDIIRRINDIPLGGPTQAIRAVYSEETKREGLRVAFERNGVEQTMVVTFADR